MFCDIIYNEKEEEMKKYNLVVYLTIDENPQTKEIPVDDITAINLSHIVAEKDEKLLQSFFDTLKDVDGNNESIDFSKVTGFEIRTC